MPTIHVTSYPSSFLLLLLPIAKPIGADVLIVGVSLTLPPLSIIWSHFDTRTDARQETCLENENLAGDERTNERTYEGQLNNV